MVAHCDIKTRQERREPLMSMWFYAQAALAQARRARMTEEDLAEERERLVRLDLWAKQRAREEEARRPTIQKYAAQLRRGSVLIRARRLPANRGTSRRVRRTVRAHAHGPPSRSTNDGDDPEPDALACPRCGSRVAVLRGIRTCSVCWANTVLELRDAA